eukprot:m.147232 g.147232  ORF g.147232 m.147232 type:complete len:501 (+) comp23135_c0_seq1:523-2025(+)
MSIVERTPDIPKWGFVTASSNEAYVISGGCFGGEAEVVCGGKAWVWPWCHRVQWISMNSWGDNSVCSQGVYTKYGVSVNVRATAVMQIRTVNDKITEPYRQLGPAGGPPHPAALMLLLDMGPELGGTRSDTRQALIDLATQTLEGHQRGFLGCMTMEQLFRDESRDDANAKTPQELIKEEVLRHAEPDLLRLGIKLTSYTINDISDDNGYLEAMGQCRIASVVAESRIGEARHKRNELINDEINDAEVAAKTYENKLKESEAIARRRTKDAENKIAESIAKAKEDFADELQRAKTQQELVTADLERQLIEKRKDVASATQEVLRTSRVLEARISRPAMSKAMAMKEEARGQRTITEMQARGKSESLKFSAAGEASAIESKGIANAEVITEKAISYNQYKGSALVDIVLRDLPKVAAEIAGPLARINSVSMVSRGGGAVGHSRLADEVSEIMNMIPASLRDMTGIDISRSIENAAASSDADGSGAQSGHLAIQPAPQSASA